MRGGIGKREQASYVSLKMGSVLVRCSSEISSENVSAFVSSDVAMEP